MNTKASNVAPGTSAADIAKFAAAAVIAIGGIAAFYLLPAWPAPVRALLVAAGFAAAIFVGSLTAAGHRGRDFVSEALFELRKVVWPTKQETIQTTIAVAIVVVVLSIILWLIDILLGWAILDHLLRSNG